MCPRRFCKRSVDNLCPDHREKIKNNSVYAQTILVIGKPIVVQIVSFYALSINQQPTRPEARPGRYRLPDPIWICFLEYILRKHSRTGGIKEIIINASMVREKLSFTICRFPKKYPICTKKTIHDIPPITLNNKNLE